MRCHSRLGRFMWVVSETPGVCLMGYHSLEFQVPLLVFLLQVDSNPWTVFGV